MSRPVVLVGLMGVGKSAVGRRLAARLGRPFVDTDAEVGARAGRSVPEVFAERGEPGFRSLETDVLVDVLGRRPPAVVAAGGGVVLAAANREALAAGAEVVWLDAAPEVLAARVGRGEGRPLLAGMDPFERLRALDAERRALYERVADHVVDATSPVDEVVDAVEAALAAGVAP